jgi:transcriptional regulator with AAA-type ATPase domain
MLSNPIQSVVQRSIQAAAKAEHQKRVQKAMILQAALLIVQDISDDLGTTNPVFPKLAKKAKQYAKEAEPLIEKVFEGANEDAQLQMFAFTNSLQGLMQWIADGNIPEMGNKIALINCLKDGQFTVEP